MTAYTNLLGLALPVNGQLSGTWGDTVNDYITKYLDAAVAGTQTVSGSQTAVTLSKTTNASLSQAGSGATGSSQYAVINCTGNPASLLTITAPAESKEYIVINATSTSQSVKIVGAGPTTGVTVVAGERCLIAWNGADFVKIGGTGGAGDFTTVDTTNLEVTNVKAKDGTAAATIADSTGVVSFSANPVLSGGTANGVAYLNGSKVLTTGSALTFDGTSAVSIGSGGTGSVTAKITLSGSNANNYGAQIVGQRNGSSTWIFGDTSSILGGSTTGLTSYVYGDNPFIWYNGGTSSEQMRLTSTGLGIGTSSPAAKLQVTSGNILLSNAYYLSSRNNANTLSISMIGRNTSDQILIDPDGYGTLIGSGGALQLNSSGNLGLGVTPSAWNSALKALDIGNFGNYLATGTTTYSGSGYTFLGNNAYFSAGANWVYRSSAASVQYRQAIGEHQWFTAPSGTAGNAISFSQVMTLDASGNWMIGSTSAGSLGGVTQAVTIKTTTNGRGLMFDNELNSAGNYVPVGIAFPGTSNNRAEIRFGIDIADTYTNIAFCTAYGPGTLTERARITSGGDFGIGTTSPNVSGYSKALTIDSANSGIELNSSGTVQGAFSTTSAGLAISGIGSSGIRIFTSASGATTERARITSGGEVYIAGTTDQGAYNLQVNGTGVWGAGAYVNGSDARLKENVQTLSDGLSVVTQLRPVTFQYKADYSKDTTVQPGFIAQELQQAMAGKDYVDGVVHAGPEYLNVAYQSLIPVLTKAIQELKAELDTVKAELQTLKGN